MGLRALVWSANVPLRFPVPPAESRSVCLLIRISEPTSCDCSEVRVGRARAFINDQYGTAFKGCDSAKYSESINGPHRQANLNQSSGISLQQKAAHLRLIPAVHRAHKSEIRVSKTPISFTKTAQAEPSPRPHNRRANLRASTWLLRARLG